MIFVRNSHSKHVVDNNNNNTNGAPTYNQNGGPWNEKGWEKFALYAAQLKVFFFFNNIFIDFFSFLKDKTNKQKTAQLRHVTRTLLQIITDHTSMRYLQRTIQWNIIYMIGAFTFRIWVNSTVQKKQTNKQFPQGISTIQVTKWHNNSDPVLSIKISIF